MPQEEKRCTPRIQPYVAPCRVLDHDRRISGYVMDLSASGARVTVEAAPPAPGTSIVIEVRFARYSSYSLLPAQVRWTKGPDGPKGTYAFGLTFEGLTGEQQQVLSAVVEAFRQRAQELA